MQRAARAARRPPRDPMVHGQHIYAYCNVRTKQVLYSLSRSLDSYQALKQLPDIGANSTPPKIRKDVWKPLFTLSMPPPHTPTSGESSNYTPNSQPSATRPSHHQGLDAFRQLREFRKLHELCWTPPPKLSRNHTEEEIEALQERLDERGGSKKESVYSLMKREKKKIRKKIVMDQKANSIADLAAVLIRQENTGTEQLLEQRRQRARDVKTIMKYSDMAKNGGIEQLVTEMQECRQLLKRDPTERVAAQARALQEGTELPVSNAAAQRRLKDLKARQRNLQRAVEIVADGFQSRVDQSFAFLARIKEQSVVELDGQTPRLREELEELKIKSSIAEQISESAFDVEKSEGHRKMQYLARLISVRDVPKSCREDAVWRSEQLEIPQDFEKLVKLIATTERHVRVLANVSPSRAMIMRWDSEVERRLAKVGLRLTQARSDLKEVLKDQDEYEKIMAADVVHRDEILASDPEWTQKLLEVRKKIDLLVSEEEMLRTIRKNPVTINQLAIDKFRTEQELQDLELKKQILKDVERAEQALGTSERLPSEGSVDSERLTEAAPAIVVLETSPERAADARRIFHDVEASAQSSQRGFGSRLAVAKRKEALGHVFATRGLSTKWNMDTLAGSIQVAATESENDDLPPWHALLPPFTDVFTDTSGEDMVQPADRVRLSRPHFSIEGARVEWANILDAEYAEEWPASVEHQHMGFVRHTSKHPEYVARMNALEFSSGPIKHELEQRNEEISRMGQQIPKVSKALNIAQDYITKTEKLEEMSESTRRKLQQQKEAMETKQVELEELQMDLEENNTQRLEMKEMLDNLSSDAEKRHEQRKAEYRLAKEQAKNESRELVSRLQKDVVSNMSKPDPSPKGWAKLVTDIERTYQRRASRQQRAAMEKDGKGSRNVDVS